MIDKTQESGALGEAGGREEDMKIVDRRRHTHKKKPSVVFTCCYVCGKVVRTARKALVGTPTRLLTLICRL